MNSSHYNAKRIALVMDVQGREVVLCGTTSLCHDPRQGQMLRVTVDDDDEASIGNPVFLISEQRWKQYISSGDAFGCELLLDLSSATVAAS